eukprot:Tamp_09848.p1 GENE.Tamp_09848~~Tamp_09848.p1  ORF type:complete len:485 (+),score=170.90 Tamp_09848:97-1455(+)
MPVAVDPAKTEALHWGHKYLKAYGLSSHYWGANGCLHDFRDLCNENYYHHHVHPFLQHTDWLDGGERLEQAHKFDEQEELAFQEATKELHNKVMVEREDWNAEMKELHQEKQDKYRAYFLGLEAEKNKTEEVLNQWKSKRDAEVAKIDADYLEKVSNMTAGRDQYKEWYSQAEELDKERRAKFHKMISDMTTAGASTKDIKTAQLAFKRQESLFEEKLKKLSSSFGEDRERMGALKSRARKELSEFKEEQAKEHAREAGAEHRYQVEEAKERAAADHAAAQIMHERAEVGKVQKQAHSYGQDLRKEGHAEAQRQNSLEARIRLLKKQEKMHAEKMQARATAEVAASEKVHAGERTGTEQVAKAHVAKVAVGKKGGDSKKEASAHASQGASKAKSGKSVQDKVVKAKEPAAAEKPKASAPESPKAKEAARQAAFLKALSQQADAEFQSLPASV